jgi:hypothetical protein
MPIALRLQPARRFIGVALLATLLASPLTAASPGVAVLRTAAWSPADTVREGAGEFEVLLCAARLQREHRVAGLVGVGDRHGLFLSGAERALRHLALQGVPVAKLARGGDVAADPEAIFLDATGLTEVEASAVLKKCLERHGPPPVAANPARPSPSELAAVRAHLKPYRDAFTLAAAPRVAAK